MTYWPLIGEQNVGVILCLCRSSLENRHWKFFKSRFGDSIVAEWTSNGLPSVGVDLELMWGACGVKYLESKWNVCGVSWCRSGVGNCGSVGECKIWMKWDGMHCLTAVGKLIKKKSDPGPVLHYMCWNTTLSNMWLLNMTGWFIFEAVRFSVLVGLVELEAPAGLFTLSCILQEHGYLTSRRIADNKMG